MVLVEKLSKVAHLIAIKYANLVSEVAPVFVKEITRSHGVPKRIISNKDSKFTFKFWKELFGGLGTELAFNTAYHL